MKINESTTQINETFVSLNPDKILIKILNHLDNGIGLSIVRIGDGEMILNTKTTIRQ